MRTLLLATGLLAALGAHAGEPGAERRAWLGDLLRQDCGSCHGLTLKGGLGPALLPARMAALPQKFIAATILDGRPGTAMPPWRGILDETDARWLARVLQTGSETK